MYWLRKLIFRGAWLDHRVKEGLLEVSWDDDVADFGYRDPNGDRALLELAPVPSWHELQFRGDPRRAIAAYLAALLAVDTQVDLTASSCSAHSRGSRCRRRPAAPGRALPQVAVVICAATVAELTGSILWGVYSCACTTCRRSFRPRTGSSSSPASR